ncbi:MAG: methylated-DNA--[protein]-cysteine S-methyltransferase [Leadbetterella sp.]
MKGIIYTQEWKSPIGELILGAFDDQLCICDWKYRAMRSAVDQRIQKFFNAEYVESSHKVIDETIDQLKVYFEGALKQFDIPLVMAGTDFQIGVWKELIKIPYGQTDTYLKLSKKLGNELAIRAVSSANGANAISILVPCHRIIGSNGELVGYAGGLPAKKKLLQLEKALPQYELF